VLPRCTISVGNARDQTVFVFGDVFLMRFTTLFDARRMRLGFACGSDAPAVDDASGAGQQQGEEERPGQGQCRGRAARGARGAAAVQGAVRPDWTFLYHAPLVGAGFAFSAACFYAAYTTEFGLWAAVVVPIGGPPVLAAGGEEAGAAAGRGGAPLGLGQNPSDERVTAAIAASLEAWQQ
jgi:hypothetical protein